MSAKGLQSQSTTHPPHCPHQALVDGHLTWLFVRCITSHSWVGVESFSVCMNLHFMWTLLHLSATSAYSCHWVGLGLHAASSVLQQLLVRLLMWVRLLSVSWFSDMPDSVHPYVKFALLWARESASSVCRVVSLWMFTFSVCCLFASTFWQTPKIQFIPWRQNVRTFSTVRLTNGKTQIKAFIGCRRFNQLRSVQRVIPCVVTLTTFVQRFKLNYRFKCICISRWR